MAYTNLITPEDLFEHLTNPDWMIADCRFELSNPSWGKAEYHRQHVPGAVYVDLNQDLSAPVTPMTGRHPLPAEEDLVRLFSRLGISDDTQVVVYDQNDGSFAARMWWLLRSMGHSAVAVLDGGFPGWLAQNRPISQGMESRKPAEFHGSLQKENFVQKTEVEGIRLDPHFRLIDARTGARFRGDEEPIDRIAGHIPGAINRFHGENLGPDGRFLPAENLKRQFLELMGDVPLQQAVFYCGSGVTSCHHLLALDYAGLPLGRLYLGSWSEWIQDPQAPIGLGER